MGVPQEYLYTYFLNSIKVDHWINPNHNGLISQKIVYSLVIFNEDDLIQTKYLYGHACHGWFVLTAKMQLSKIVPNSDRRTL